jgi:hypothetical protein
MGDAGLAALAAALPTRLGPRLEGLRAGDWQVTTAGARALVQALMGATHLTGLKTLAVNASVLLPQEEDELRAMLRMAPHVRACSLQLE